MRVSQRAQEIQRAVRSLVRLGRGKNHPLALAQQPFDSLLLLRSALYRRSRELSHGHSCLFEPAILSSPRSLGGSALLENRVQYSPIEDELIFAALDPCERGIRLEDLRTFTTSVFHEQNHRLLWSFLQPPPVKPDSIRRYLNFVESLVVISDMALSDHLGEKLARTLYLVGAIYDPGSTIRKSIRNKSTYRRYLLAAMHATYLNLELYEPSEVERIVQALFGKGPLIDRAIQRALRLDRQFVLQTNPIWQYRNRAAVVRFFKRGSEKLDLAEDPFQPGIALLWAERWLDYLKIQ